MSRQIRRGVHGSLHERTTDDAEDVDSIISIHSIHSSQHETCPGLLEDAEEGYGRKLAVPIRSTPSTTTPQSLPQHQEGQQIRWDTSNSRRADSTFNNGGRVFRHNLDDSISIRRCVVIFRYCVFGGNDAYCRFLLHGCRHAVIYFTSMHVLQDD